MARSWVEDSGVIVVRFKGLKTRGFGVQLQRSRAGTFAVPFRVLNQKETEDI